MRHSENILIAAGYIIADANVIFQKAFYKVQHCSYTMNLFTEKNIVPRKLKYHCNVCFF